MSYDANKTGQCPHCRKGVRFEAVGIMVTPSKHTHGDVSGVIVTSQSGHRNQLRISACPVCSKNILLLFTDAPPSQGTRAVVTLLWPVSGQRLIPQEVEQADADVAEDYKEAALVLGLSPKSSAALARRCLQAVLVSKADAPAKADLSKQIDHALPQLPTHIAANVDAIRTVGNFAAHQIKSTDSGAIVDVEPGEAEWTLDVLDDLFEFYYVRPAMAEAKRIELNRKLVDAGKPPLKTLSAE